MDREAVGRTALIPAAGHGSSPLCALLINAGAEVNATDSNGSTALALASWNGHHRATRVLLRARADVDVCSDKAKYTPLMAAARWGHSAVVRELLAAKADSSIKTA